MQPKPPVIVSHLFPEERAALLDLLADLTKEEWAAPTACAGWSVKDVAAHLIADDLGRVSRGRDGYRSPAFAAVSGWDDLVAAINQVNEEWVQAMRRLSPALIRELLAFSGERSLAVLTSRDPLGLGGPVDWAGPEPAPVWLDLAREYTERWHHQQQIRDGAGRPPLTDRPLFFPVLDTFVHALPHTYRHTPAAEGTHVRFLVTGEAGGAWSLVMRGGRWGLYEGVTAPPAATLSLDQDAAWRRFTRGMTREAARGRATMEGDQTLAAVALDTLAIIA